MKAFMYLSSLCPTFFYLFCSRLDGLAKGMSEMTNLVMLR
jgi:hypothetical protein